MDTVNLPHPFIVQRPLFKAYDIRGDQQLFTDDFVAVLAQVFAEHYQQAGATVVVMGYDARHASPLIADKLTHALTTVGIKVLRLGLVTTPMMAFCAEQHEGHGIMVTASHSAKQYAGIKWLTHHQSPTSDDIGHLYHRMAQVDITSNMAHGRDGQNNTNKPNPLVQPLEVFVDYQQAIKRVCQTLISSNTICQSRNQSQNQHLDNKSKPLMVIDCLNGATSAYAERLFGEIAQMTGFAQSIIALNDNADGDFPKGDPDPTAVGRLAELADAVVRHNAKLGLAFDGDGDRLCVIDEQGRPLSQDNLLYLLGHVAISDARSLQSAPASSPQPQNPTVLFDVKCSHLLPKLIQADGGMPILTKTGSSHLRHALKHEYQHALFAGELSGHFIFNDGHFVLHDDAMYAAARLLIWLHKQPHSLASIIDALPSAVSTADVYLPLPAQSAHSAQLAQLAQSVQSTQSQRSASERPIMDALLSWYRRGQSLFGDTPAKFVKLDTTDGMRLEYEHGVGVVRASNTSPSLTCRIAGDDLQHFNAIKANLVALCQQVDNQLALQIANIRPHGHES